MGPTATGKTDLAVAIVQRFAAEIISVDSTLVYRDMVIGSARPDAQTLARAPHHLIDFIDPAENYSAGRFRDDALALMAQITQRGHTPLLAGGTMLYFHALQRGIADLPGADAAVRANIEDELRREGLAALHARLRQVDPEAARRIHPNDPQRIKRALEVFDSSGKPLSAFWREQARLRLPYRRLKIALMPSDRAALRRRIAQRFDAMLAQGLIEEVERLRVREDLHAGLPSIRSVGYRQVWAYLEGEYDFDTMREKAIIATAQLAKRQITWLRKETGCNVFDPLQINTDEVLKKLGNLLD